MGKHEFLTPKAIANRLKAKRLQKLRWYCQMCKKQCPDQNGFKCHCLSESHRRQMEIFGQNPNLIIEEFSKRFENSFLNHMNHSHPVTRIAATVVYNEFVRNRNHIHMNSTRWLTLTEFVKYLGRTGKCKVEETPKGWFMTYINKDPETLLNNKRIKFDMVEEENQEKEIEKQMERAKQLMQPFAIGSDQPSQKELPRDQLKLEYGVQIQCSLPSSTKRKGPRPVFYEVEDAKKVERNPLKRKESDGVKSTTLDLLIWEEEEQKKREKMKRKDYWLQKGIVVKVMSKALADKGYYKQKGVVVKVIDKYVGEIVILESKHVLRVDQAELETVIPQIGGLVKIVNGAYCGSTARLLGLDIDHFCAKVQIERGPYVGRILKAMEYEDICKLLTR